MNKSTKLPRLFPRANKSHSWCRLWKSGFVTFSVIWMNILWNWEHKTATLKGRTEKIQTKVQDTRPRELFPLRIYTLLDMWLHGNFMDLGKRKKISWVFLEIYVQATVNQSCVFLCIPCCLQTHQDKHSLTSWTPQALVLCVFLQSCPGSGTL